MLLSKAKAGTKVFHGKIKGEISYIPTFVDNPAHKNYNCVAFIHPLSPYPLGELIHISELTEIRTIEITDDDLISCDSGICAYCIHNQQCEAEECNYCGYEFDLFLGVEAYRTKED